MANKDVSSDDHRISALTSIGTYSFNPTKTNIAFGNFALPVLMRKIKDSDILERKRAVQRLCDYAFDPQHTACKEFSVSAAGRKALLQKNFCSETLSLLDDDTEAVRLAANTVFQRVAVSPIGAESLVEAGIIPKLIDRIPQEPQHILVLNLDTLHFCCLVDADKALTFKGLEAVIPLLKNPSPSVREKAAIVVTDLSVEAKGRNRAIDGNALPPLLELCHDEDVYVQAKALAAIMMIANATPGRFMAIDGRAIEKILPLLESEEIEIRLNALKVLTALAEAPPGRKALLGHINRIISMMYDKVQEIRRAAKKAVDVVNYTP